MLPEESLEIFNECGSMTVLTKTIRVMNQGLFDENTQSINLISSDEEMD